MKCFSTTNDEIEIREQKIRKRIYTTITLLSSHRINKINRSAEINCFSSFLINFYKIHDAFNCVLNMEVIGRQQ